MLKKLLIGLAVVATLLLIGGYLYRDQIAMMMAFGKMKPSHAFADAPPPAAPDYSNPESWAALPDRTDPADLTPTADVADRQATAEVDVFFIHPTTYYRPASWNQPLDEADTNVLTDMFVMRGQASVYNSCCRIYAPRYRQATLFSFLDDTGSGKQALEVAYGDVERAFDYFLEHYSAGRPFVLASHSQGSLHLRTLLEKRVTGTPLRERLVAAYAIGFGMDRDELAKATPDIPVCGAPDQTGCLVTWNAIGPEARKFGDAKNPVCVNPLTWRDDGAAAEHSLNLGAVTYPANFEGTIADFQGVPQEYIDAKPVLEAGVADAQCVEGMLLVQEIRSALYGARPMGRDNYHIYDYSLFHMNLRRNAEARVQAYLAERATAPSTAE